MRISFYGSKVIQGLNGLIQWFELPYLVASLKEPPG